ncbi:hypothetical protein J5N97_008945 [Dioscorea zingiberensis]|uniref:Uncharacterized protein n=1 Tax=Dioscorea zingiberensis TaxID=325984 RepID=A0A9D5CVG2_9LILI|nr:hypothetical protein J5N97_008945 [Dioscorea zingiberensis]
MADSGVESRKDLGKLEYGCQHYKRRCKIRAPCCGEVFPCRHCHNESTSTHDRHEIRRQEIERVICLVCETEQPAVQVCSSCGVNMGEYFCTICKFYDDDITKGQYHCDDCGICRVGGKDNFFHCQRCGSCYSTDLRDNHPCVENSMKQYCPICCEYLFDSLKGTRVMKCGHTIHADCFNEMLNHAKYMCPICSKSTMDMSAIWRQLDLEIEATVMPEIYRDKKVWILCNDCNNTTEVLFHILGHKCEHCGSYNTRNTSTPVSPE